MRAILGVRSEAGGHARAIILLFVLSLAGAPAGHAIDVPGLYSAQVSLDPEEDDPRAAAYQTALYEVLLRVSGSALSANPELVEALFPDPAAYVIQFRPGVDDTLWVSFDGTAIEKVLRQAGQAVWSSERPLTLVWLAVDWGQGEREIIGADDPERLDDEARSIDRNRLLRQRVLDIAERRGLPVVFPLLDVEDLEKLTFADIWGGFDELVLDASRRYDAPSVLVGRVRPGSGQRNRWSYYFGSEERVWSGEPELVMTLIADMLAAEFAVGGDAALVAVNLNVSGVTSVEAYADLQQTLADLTVIETLSITAVEGDRISYRVEAFGGSERLARALRLSGLIEQERIDDGTFDSLLSVLDFYYSP